MKATIWVPVHIHYQEDTEPRDVWESIDEIGHETHCSSGYRVLLRPRVTLKAVREAMKAKIRKATKEPK